MKALIEINCEDSKSLMNHLTEIKIQINRALHEDIGSEIKIVESSCFGDHEVRIWLDA